VLADLDELVLHCRDERARAYISEAVACYKVGAYRSAIIATWIAVTFDIIDKLRELSLAGDGAATKLIEHFDAITTANDVPSAQRFERQLLPDARDKFELISAQEYIDLERLQTDRHRCAHPSQSGVGEVFSPSGELARVHIRSAIEHLLRHEPAQGKAALENILGTIESNYFPVRESKALVILGKSPLRRPRPSLVRNLTLVLLKGLIKGADHNVMWRRTTAFTCIRTMHPAQWLQTVQQNLTRLVRAISAPDEMMRAATLLYVHPDVANSLEDDQVVRLSEFVKKLPKQYITRLSSILDTGPLSEAVAARIRALTLEELRMISDEDLFGLEPQLCERLIDGYIQVTSFDQANEWAKLLQTNIHSLSEHQLNTLLEGAIANDQIRGSFQLKHVIAAIKKLEKAKTSKIAELTELLEMTSS